MKAVVYHRYGNPGVLEIEELPRPVATEGSVVIKVKAASVNPADWQIRSGKRFRLIEPFSMVPGSDLAGVVEEVGLNVTGIKVGDQVFGIVPLNMEMEGRGSYAEFVAVPSGTVARMPPGMSFEQAAALPVAVQTSWSSLFVHGGLVSGQMVLIHAAAGGVGHIAVQMAKYMGARVAGTASGRNQEFLREIGVDVPIDYETTRFEDVVRDIDIVLDTVIHDADSQIDLVASDTLERSWQVLKKDGILVSITSTPDQAKAAEHGVRAAYAGAGISAYVLEKITEPYKTGQLKPHISHIFSLEQAKEAHEFSQLGHTCGKIILRVGSY